MGVEHLGRLSLVNLDARAHEELTTFRDLCVRKCVSLEATWETILKHCVEMNPHARIREVSFAHAAHQMGFEGDTSIVFAACDLEKEHTICMQDMTFLGIGN